MPRYAQIDSNGLCVAVSDLSGEVNAPHMIPIGDGDFLGRTYSAGAWGNPPPSSPVVPTIDARALRKKLLAANKLTTLRTALQSNADMLIDWETLQTLRRDDALVEFIRTTLGFTSAQVDKFFERNA